MFDYQAPSNLLNSRIILVTGAGDGIGKTAALAYAQHGAQVILLGRKVSKLEKVYDEIMDAGGLQPAILPLDLAKAEEADYAQIAQAIEHDYGRLDGLLHNAADLGSLTPIGLYNLEQWSRVLHVNLTAPFLLTRYCLALLEKSADASVIFTSSSVGRQGRAYWGAYAASKAGIENLMQTLADELKDSSHIRVNTLNPGATRTTMRARAYPAEDVNTLPLPETRMPAYLYLMGPSSLGVTGQAFDA